MINFVNKAQEKKILKIYFPNFPLNLAISLNSSFVKKISIRIMTDNKM